jgi:MSHA biogenesis protein MshO
MARLSRTRGFSLIELVITIVLLGIIGAAIAIFIGPAARAYLAQTQRAALVDSAESALRRIARDIRVAVPNSVRVTPLALTLPDTGFALELIPSVDGGRYCLGDADCSTRPPGGGAGILFNNLAVAATDTDFSILGCFRNTTFTAAAAGGTTAYRLVIDPRMPADIYGATGAAGEVITPSGKTITLSVTPNTPAGSACGVGTGTLNQVNVHHIAIGTGGYDFMADSTRRRVYVIQDAPVTYICNSQSGTLVRYSGYTIQNAQPTDPSVGPLNGIGVATGRVASNVSACGVTDTVGIQGKGLVTLDLSVKDPASAETVRLVHQVQLDNSQ